MEIAVGTKSFLKSAYIYSIGGIIPKLTLFILLPVYTKYLNPSDYGIISSMDLLSSILLIFFTFSLEKSIYRLYHDYKTDLDKKDFLGTVAISISIIATVIGCLLMLYSHYVQELFKSIPFFPYYFASIMFSYFSCFTNFIEIYFRVKNKPIFYFVYNISNFLMVVLFTIYFVVITKHGAIGAVIAPALVSILYLPINLILLKKICNFKFKYNMFLASIKFSYPLIPSSIAAWVLNLSDRIFIEKYFNLYEVGIYSLAYKIAGFSLIFSNSLYNAYNPIFYKIAGEEEPSQAKKSLFEYNRFIVIVLIVSAFIVSLFSKELIIIFSHKEYYEAYKLIPLISFGYLITMIDGISTLSIYQAKKTNKVMYMILISAFANIALNFLLVPRYKGFGAAFATIISFLILFLLKYNYSQKCYFVKWDIKNHFKLLIPFSVVIVFFIYYIQIQNVLFSILIKIFIMILLVFVFLKTKFIDLKKLLLLANRD